MTVRMQYGWALEFRYSNVCSKIGPGNFLITKKCSANNSSIDLLKSNSHSPSLYTLSMRVPDRLELCETEPLLVGEIVYAALDGGVLPTRPAHLQSVPRGGTRNLPKYKKVRFYDFKITKIFAG